MKWKNKICVGTPQFSGFYGLTNKNKKKIKSKDIRSFFKLLKKKTNKFHRYSYCI